MCVCVFATLRLATKLAAECGRGCTCAQVLVADVPAIGGPAPATGGHAGGPTILDNAYFTITHNETDVKCRIRTVWHCKPPLGLGRLPTMSKTMSPGKNGETIDDPVRSVMVLRAWMLWRARSVPGWVDAKPERARLFREEAEHLLRDVINLQPQVDGLLGHPFSSQWLRDHVPDVCAAVAR